MTKKTQNWSLVVDRYVEAAPVYSIRRWSNGKLERYPAAKYRKLQGKLDELQALVARLNYSAERAAKEKAAIRSAFLPPEFLAEYQVWLQTQVPREKGARQEYSYLHRYFLTPFVNLWNMDSPQEWAENSETKWARYLLGADVPAASKTKRDIINAANRFLRYLHKKRPDEVPLLELEPLSPAKFDSLDAQREMDDEARKASLITKEDWRIMERALRNYPKLAPFLRLGHAYGLRRAELVALQPGDVRKGHLSVTRQLERVGQYTYLKGKQKRNVEHWYATPAQAHAWLTTIQTEELVVHPRTLSAYFDEFIAALRDEKKRSVKERLSQPYTLHDLRHTFITRALRDHGLRDTQLAAGHKHISTTMSYAHDDRDTSDEAYAPA